MLLIFLWKWKLCARSIYRNLRRRVIERQSKSNIDKTKPISVNFIEIVRKMLKTILFVLACACASKPESLAVGANSNNNGKNFKSFFDKCFFFSSYDFYMKEQVQRVDVMIDCNVENDLMITILVPRKRYRKLSNFCLRVKRYTFLVVFYIEKINREKGMSMDTK